MAGSSVIGALRVNLGLDTAAFSAGVKQAQTRLGQFADTLNKRLGKLGDLPGLRQLQGTLSGISANAAAAVGTMAATASAALGAMSISAINSAKELQNLSRLANATPEEFQRMAYAADQVGISQEKFSDILKDVNDRVGDFVATGGGPMADFFEKIAPKVGVTAEQFRKLSGPQALQLYVDSLEKAGVNQQDFTFFMEAMASDSTALLPILRNGGKAAQEYGDRLAALGGVRSNESVARLAAMKTVLGEVGVVLRGVKNSLGAAFAPIMEALARTFTSLMTEGSALRLVFDGIAAAVGLVADVFGAVVNIISHVIAGIWNLTSAAASWINQATGIGDAIKLIWDWTIGWVADIIVGTSQAISGLGGLGGAFSALKDIASETWERIKTGLGALEEYFIGAGYGIAWAFTRAFGMILSGFARMTQGIADGWNALMGSLGIESNAKGLGVDAAAAVNAQAKSLLETGAASFASGNAKLAASVAPLESVAAVNAKIAASAADAADALGEGGLGGGLEETGKKAGGGAAKLTKFQEVMKALREEAEKLRATMGMTDLQEAIWGKQREAGVSANSLQGQQIAGIMQQIDGLQRLKDAAEKGRDAFQGLFESFLDGVDAARQGLANLLKEIAKVQFAKGMMGLLGATSWGSKLIGAVGGLSSYDGGGYTWDGPRTGGIDGRGGRLAILHPQETVLDHTRGQGGGIAMSASQLTLSDDGRIMATVRAEMSNGFAAADRSLPARVQQINANPRRR